MVAFDLVLSPWTEYLPCGQIEQVKNMYADDFMGMLINLPLQGAIPWKLF